MAVFGLTPAGFLPKRLADIKSDLEDAWRTAFGQNVRVDSESVSGQVIGIMSERMADMWDQMEKVNASAYLNGASGVGLDDLVSLASITREAATFSLVTLNIAGVNSTVIPAGSVVRDPVTLVQWVTTGSVTISGGVATITAQPTSTGPILAVDGTLTEIVTPVSGWSSVTNTQAAVPGTNAETDAALRTRYNLAMRSGLGCSADAIRADMLRLDGVTEAYVIENMTLVEDADGMPPFSFEVVVRGGDDQEIIDAIWAGKPAGIQTTGNTSGTAVDSVGDGHTIYFTRPVEVDVYVGIDLTVLPNFEMDGEDQIIAAVFDYGTMLNVGSDVIPIQIVQHIEVLNILGMTLKIGFGPNPPGTSPITITKRQLAKIDTSFVTINRLN